MIFYHIPFCRLAARVEDQESNCPHFSHNMRPGPPPPAAPRPLEEASSSHTRSDPRQSSLAEERAARMQRSTEATVGQMQTSQRSSTDTSTRPVLVDTRTCTTKTPLTRTGLLPLQKTSKETSRVKLCLYSLLI